MTLLQMTYILEINRCGSMNKAAQRLFVTQSAISGAIADVEKELGITVFVRTNRGIVLTEEGSELLIQIAPIVERSKAIEHFYAERNPERRLKFSIASQRYPFCAKAFVEFLGSIDARKMQLSFKEMEMADVIADVAERKSDLGVLFVSDITEHFITRILQTKGLVFEGLVSIQPHVFLRKEHPLARCEVLTTEQLRPYPYVMFSQTDNNLNFAEEAVPLSDLDYDRLIFVTDRATFYNITAHTDAFSIGSGILPEGYSDERLLSVPLEGPYRMKLGYIHPSGSVQDETTEAFLEILRKLTKVHECGVGTQV